MIEPTLIRSYLEQISDVYKKITTYLQDDPRRLPDPELTVPQVEHQRLTEVQRNKLRDMLKTSPCDAAKELKQYLGTYENLLSYGIQLTDTEKYWVDATRVLVTYILKAFHGESRELKFPTSFNAPGRQPSDHEYHEHYLTLFALMEYYVRHLSE